MIGSMSVPIGNRFHATRANSSKKPLLGGTPLSRPRAQASLKVEV